MTVLGFPSALLPCSATVLGRVGPKRWISIGSPLTTSPEPTLGTSTRQLCERQSTLTPVSLTSSSAKCAWISVVATDDQERSRGSFSKATETCSRYGTLRRAPRTPPSSRQARAPSAWLAAFHTATALLFVPEEIERVPAPNNGVAQRGIGRNSHWVSPLTRSRGARTFDYLRTRTAMGAAGHVLTGLLYFFDPYPAIRRTPKPGSID